MHTKDSSAYFQNDVIIPNYQPLNIPYTEWEAHRSQQLLATNGFENTVEGWHKATQHPSGLIRGTAFYLLAQNPMEDEQELFLTGLSDIDETTQAFCAWSLYKLGDKEAIAKLKAMANLEVDAHIAAIQAAGILGQLGIADAYKTILAAMESDLGHIHVFGMHNAFFFVPLHGKFYHQEKQIHIWNLYSKALKNDSHGVRSIAIAQLKEINSKESQELLKK